MKNLLNTFVQFDAPVAWGIYFQDSATPLPKWSGKSFLGFKLPNSGDFLKLMVLSHIWKYMSDWTNHSGTVTSHKMFEKTMDYRGSKSIIDNKQKFVIVKEQRVYGSWWGINLPYLRCTLKGFERNSQNKILTTQLINKINYSTLIINNGDSDNNHDIKIDPYFLTGFADAESSFVLSITKSNIVKSGWVIKPRFQIHLHKKDLFVLEAIKNFLGVGKIYVNKGNSVEFRVFSIRELKVILNHFEKFPLISQKYGDYFLFKQAYELLIKREHLTSEGLRKIISIKASINNGLSEQLKIAFPDNIPVQRPINYKISICNSQWLAGFTSGEGSFGVKIRNPKGNSFIVELIFQINQHTRDKQLITHIAEYLECGKVYKHSVNAIVYRVSKRSDLTERIIPFFIKYPILGIKALDFQDFCFISKLIKNKLDSKEVLGQIIRIKTNMNTGRVLD